MAVRTYRPGDAAALLDLQRRYARSFPGAQVIPPPVYSGPGFAGGRNVLCAVAADGAVVGYAAVYAGSDDNGGTADDNGGTAAVHGGANPEAGSSLPRRLWAVIKPDADLREAQPVQELLYAHLLARVEELRQRLPPGPVELRFEHLPGEALAIGFALANGFAHVASAYHMVRDLSRPIAAVPIGAPVEVRLWQIATEDEQRRYLTARNRCFPGAPMDLDSLRFLLASPLWREGTSVTAFAGDEVAGSVLVYWDEDENAPNARRSGYTEEVFVLPRWRGHGLARHLLTEAMLYLRQHGLDQAQLQVLVTNDRALDLYRDLGYVAESEARHLAKTL